eukprot:5741030-Heterocapsa_arctica.AAC.1
MRPRAKRIKGPNQRAEVPNYYITKHEMEYVYVLCSGLLSQVAVLCNTNQRVARHPAASAR